MLISVQLSKNLVFVLYELSLLFWHLSTWAVPSLHLLLLKSPKHAKMLWLGYQSFRIYNQRPTCKRRFLVPGGLDQLQEDGGRVDIPGVLHRPEEHLKAVVVLARVHHRVHQPLDDVGWQLRKNKLVRSPSGPGFDYRHFPRIFLLMLLRFIDGSA